MPETLYELQRNFLMTIDPVHIGTGGYRLGRVDNSIVREPGTNVPKIPGTTLSGASRAYAAMRYDKRRCAGQGLGKENNKEPHCGIAEKCPICYTFGTATSQNEGFAGTVNISDGHILFFPVQSMAGPLWVSTLERIGEALGGNEEIQEPENNQILTTLDWRKEHLNLGWILLKSGEGIVVKASGDLEKRKEWATISGRIAIVKERLFSHIVNSNLEVRTSVSIDQTTGTAEEGALFTYEAIPRATWLWCDIVEDQHLDCYFPITERQCLKETSDDEKGKKKYSDNKGNPLGEKWERSLDVFNSGMRMMEYFGVGGMGTRGFGRIRLLALEVK